MSDDVSQISGHWLADCHQGHLFQILLTQWPFVLEFNSGYFQSRKVPENDRSGGIYCGCHWMVEEIVEDMKIFWEKDVNLCYFHHSALLTPYFDIVFTCTFRLRLRLTPSQRCFLVDYFAMCHIVVGLHY